MNRVAICRVVVPAPQPEPASHLKSATRDVSFLRSDSRCRRYVSDLSNVTPRYLGSEQKGRVLLLKLTFSSRLACLLLRWKAADTVRLPCPWSAPLPLPAMNKMEIMNKMANFKRSKFTSKAVSNLSLQKKPHRVAR